jgi:hypothetical protein
MSCNVLVTAIKTAADCQEACGKCKPTWATAQKPLLQMCLSSIKINDCSRLVESAHGVVQSGQKPAVCALFRVLHSAFHSLFRRICEKAGWRWNESASAPRNLHERRRLTLRAVPCSRGSEVCIWKIVGSHGASNRSMGFSLTSRKFVGSWPTIREARLHGLQRGQWVAAL